MKNQRKILILSVLAIIILGAESAKAVPVGTTADTRPAAPQQRKQWEEQGLNLQLGGNFLSGNIDFLTINSSLSYNYNLGKNQFFIDAGNIFTKAGENVIANRLNVSGLYAYNLLDNFNLYGYTTHTYDSSIKLDYRLTNGLGVCLHKIAAPIFKLFLISLGGATENEWFQENNTQFAVRSVLRVNTLLPVTDFVDIGFDSFYTPAIPDLSDFRIYGEAFVKFNITPDTLSLKLSLADEFDSRPRPGVKNNDFGAFMNLSFDIGK